jgi:hypothetical protein
MVGNLISASSSSDGEQFVIISAKSSPDGDSLFVSSIKSILRPYFIASHNVPDGTRVSQCAITTSKFKNSWCMVIGIAPLTYYGELLKLDYFDAATF